MDNPERLREVYIEHMDAITINLEVNSLDIKSPDYIKLENELENKKQEVESMNDRLSAIENMIYANDGLIGVVDKFKK